MTFHSEIAELVSVHCNIVDDDYQHDSRILCTFIPNTSFGQLLDIFPKSFIFWRTFNSELFYTEVWITDQNSKPLEIGDKMNITLVINQSARYKEWFVIQFNLEI